MDVQTNRRPLELVGHDLTFGWHGYLWYGKAKVNVDLKKKHFVRHAILGIWNRYKLKLCPQIPLWLTQQETFYRREMIIKYKLSYLIY